MRAIIEFNKFDEFQAAAQSRGFGLKVLGSSGGSYSRSKLELPGKTVPIGYTKKKESWDPDSKFIYDDVTPETVILLIEYSVLVTGPDGTTKCAFVYKQQGRAILNTQIWGSDQRRLRISLGKRPHIIGNKLKWVMAKTEED